MDFETIIIFLTGWFLEKVRRCGKKVLDTTWILFIRRDLRFLFLAQTYIAIIQTAAILKRDGKLKPTTVERLDRLFKRWHASLDRRSREVGWGGLA